MAALSRMESEMQQVPALLMGTESGDLVPGKRKKQSPDCVGSGHVRASSETEEEGSRNVR